MPTPPPPEGFHIIVVHFPIALLMVAPLFVLIGAFTGARLMMISALLLMLLGVAGAFAATSTGEAAMKTMGVEGDFPIDGDKYDVAYEVLNEHEEMGHLVRNLFAGLAVLYMTVVSATTLLKRCGRFFPRLGMHLVFLALYAYPLIMLANTAHDGGRLVHEFELRSVVAETADGEPDYAAELARYQEEEAEEDDEESPQDPPAEPEQPETEPPEAEAA